MELREKLRQLAKEMGDAGYCNYEACEMFLDRAASLALEEARLIANNPMGATQDEIASEIAALAESLKGK